MRKLKHEEIQRADPEALAALPKHPIRVVADNIRSIHNVGSLFRTSDAARIEHLYLTGFTGTPEHRGLHKSALGSQQVVPWSYHADAVSLVETLRQEAFTIVALEITDEPTSINEIGLGSFPMVLLIGNEISGVDDRLIALSDLAIEIRQFGIKQSLNVSVAYGIAIFDLVRRQRMLAVPDDTDFAI